MNLFRELNDKPFEYIADATRTELKDLASLFSKLLALLYETTNNAYFAFHAGDKLFEVPEELRNLKDELSEQARGTSPTAKLLAKFFKGGSLRKPEQ